MKSTCEHSCSTTEAQGFSRLGRTAGCALLRVPLEPETGASRWTSVSSSSTSLGRLLFPSPFQFSESLWSGISWFTGVGSFLLLMTQLFLR